MLERGKAVLGMLGGFVRGAAGDGGGQGRLGMF